MKLFFTSDEVANHLNIPLSTLNYYLKEFRVQVLQVKRVRKFSHKDLDKLTLIVNLIENQGFTIEGAKEKLKEKKNTEKTNAEVIARLNDIKNTLKILKEAIIDDSYEGSV